MVTLNNLLALYVCYVQIYNKVVLTQAGSANRIWISSDDCGQMFELISCTSARHLETIK